MNRPLSEILQENLNVKNKSELNRLEESSNQSGVNLYGEGILAKIMMNDNQLEAQRQQ